MPTCTASSSACSRTECGCFSLSPTRLRGSIASTGSAQRGRDAPALPRSALLSAQALGAGVDLLAVTLGPRGAAYVAAPGFDGLRAGGPAVADRRRCERRSSPALASRRSTPPDAATCSARRPSPGSWLVTTSRPRSGTPRPWRPQCGAPRRRWTGAAPARRAARPVTRVIEIPAHLDDRSFEQFAAGFGDWPPQDKVLFDARGAQWASPYGLIGMLTAGQALAEARRERPLFAVPTSAEVKRIGPGSASFATPTICSSCMARCPRPRPRVPRTRCST